MRLPIEGRPRIDAFLFDHGELIIDVRGNEERERCSQQVRLNSDLKV